MQNKEIQKFTKTNTPRPSSPRSVAVRGIGAAPYLYSAISRTKTLRNDVSGIKKRVSAFTLIELLVVVLIIGILAAVAIPQYKKAVKKAHYAKMLPVLMQVVDVEKLFYLQNGSYTAYLNQLDALPFEIKNESCPGAGRRIEDYCVELHSYGTDKCLSVIFPNGKFGLTDGQAWNSGYIYCFEPLAKDNSGVGHVIPHGGPWCWEEGYWPPKKKRSDFHCTGELIHNNFHGAWFYI